ncbi:MAG: hypothetical protein AB2693_32020 [Candidatus Thiodiazotropha sp.]
MASTETVCDLLLPAETFVHVKWLPAETLFVILLPAEILGKKQTHADRLCRKPFFADGSLSRKQEIVDSLGGSQIYRQSLKEAKIGGLVYTLFIPLRGHFTFRNVIKEVNASLDTY